MDDGRHALSAPVVGAVIVTFRRPEVVLKTLAAVMAQSAPIAAVVVVDNDADPLVHATIASQWPSVQYLPLADNRGFAAVLAAGIDWLCARIAPAWYWLLDDDSPPDHSALGSALAVAENAAGGGGAVGVVANRGGHIIRGRIRHDLRQVQGSEPRVADFTLVDGAIVAAAVAAEVGVPRADLFMMLEDIEYTTRARLAGWRLLVRPMDDSAFFHLGSSADWRGYYQARNHLRVAVDLHQWSWLWGWWVRETGIGLNLLRRRRYRALRLRWRGAFDGVRNRMGKVVVP